MSKIIPTILCGGSGTRLWPASRESLSKQFIRLMGEESTFQLAARRVARADIYGRPIVILHQDARFIAAEQLSEIDIAAEIVLETFVYAGSGGDPDAALAELKRLSTAGIDVSSALAALGRHFTQLHRVATTLAEGGSTDQALRALRPRPHFKREPDFLAHAKQWGARRLAEALPQIQEAIRRTRLQPEFDAAFAERLLLTLTSKALTLDRHART